MVEVRALSLPGVFEILPTCHRDSRGTFSETWNAATLAAKGITTAFMQDNQSDSPARGVLRGLHYQDPPVAQAKLIRVTRGAIWDVAVDIRQGSPSYGRWVALTVSAAAWNQLFVPEGFAHGFVTLEPDCEVLYKLSAPYSPAHDRAIRWNDPAIGIEWPVAAGELTLSDKDRAAPTLAEARPPFRYAG